MSLGAGAEGGKNVSILDPANDDYSYACLGTLHQTKSVKGDTPTA